MTAPSRASGSAKAGRPGPPALPLALTIGDPAGIGPDITLAAWLQRVARDLPPFVVSTDKQATRMKGGPEAVQPSVWGDRAEG